jgi:hypothetical protein
MIYVLLIIFIENRMTGVENSTGAHRPPPQSGLKLVCNINIVHRPALILYCTTVLYPTVQRGEGIEL